MDGLPALVNLCGFQLYRLAADGAAKQIRSEKDIKGGGHVKASVADHEIAQETDAQNGSNGGMCNGCS